MRTTKKKSYCVEVYVVFTAVSGACVGCCTLLRLKKICCTLKSLWDRVVGYKCGCWEEMVDRMRVRRTGTHIL